MRHVKCISLISPILLILAGCDGAPSTDTSVTTSNTTKTSSTVTAVSTPKASTPTAAAVLPTATTASSSVASSTPTTTSFSIKTNSAVTILKEAGPVYNAQDCSNGLMAFGDNNSTPTRVAMTFPINTLSGKSLATAKLKIVLDAVGAGSFISNMGNIQVYQLAGVRTPGSTSYLAAETSSGLPIVTDSLHVNSYDSFEVDISTQLQNSITNGDQYFTIKMRTQNETGGGTNIMNFFCDYNSLDSFIYPKIPLIYGTY